MEKTAFAFHVMKALSALRKVLQNAHLALRENTQILRDKHNVWTATKVLIPSVEIMFVPPAPKTARHQQPVLFQKKPVSVISAFTELLKAVVRPALPIPLHSISAQQLLLLVSVRKIITAQTEHAQSVLNILPPPSVRTAWMTVNATADLKC